MEKYEKFFYFLQKIGIQNKDNTLA